VTLDGKPDNSFQFNAATGKITSGYKLLPGSHTLVVTGKNTCGQDRKSVKKIVAANVEVIDIEDVSIEDEKYCGIRFNPGNADWQFCLITPKGSYNRSDLTDNNFKYSGTASKAYFKPIAGGGKATVAGKPYELENGKYYLFTGNLKVTVSRSNSGSVGQWSICIEADKNPQFGIGNNQPVSPCTENNNNGNSDDNNGGKNNKVDNKNSQDKRNN
ncbi:MAG: hypothetical protein JXR58_11255, partial [Bacteroidales bacterium]|nr:hypothetical protein [Bacteroidales bacterium]